MSKENKLYLLVWKLEWQDEADWTHEVSNFISTDEAYKLALDYINSNSGIDDDEITADSIEWLYCDSVNVEGYKIKLERSK